MSFGSLASILSSVVLLFRAFFSFRAALHLMMISIYGSRIQGVGAMDSLNSLNVTLVAKLAPLCTPAVQWIALLCLCSAYLQGGLTKAFDFSAALAEMKQFGLKPPVPLALAVIVMEIGASVLVLSGFFRWAGALMLGIFTLFATFVANRFWDAPLPKRYATENSFFEHLGLFGAFILVAWYDLQG